MTPKQVGFESFLILPRGFGWWHYYYLVFTYTGLVVVVCRVSGEKEPVGAQEKGCGESHQKDQAEYVIGEGE